MDQAAWSWKLLHASLTALEYPQHHQMITQSIPKAAKVVWKTSNLESFEVPSHDDLKKAILKCVPRLFGGA